MFSDVALAQVFLEKGFHRQRAEIREREMQRLMILVPPGELGEALADGLRETPLDEAGRIAADDGVGGDVLGDDGAGRDHGAGADIAAAPSDLVVSCVNEGVSGPGSGRAVVGCLSVAGLRARCANCATAHSSRSSAARSG